MTTPRQPGTASATGGGRGAGLARISRAVRLQRCCSVFVLLITRNIQYVLIRRSRRGEGRGGVRREEGDSQRQPSPGMFRMDSTRNTTLAFSVIIIINYSYSPAPAM